jgi:DNA-binding MarR family transcriptional regulator
VDHHAVHRTFSSETHLTIEQFRAVILSLVRGGDDHTSRQLALFLCLRDGEATVRGLAEHMGVTKPVVTRAVDRGVEDRYVERKPDPADRRSVLVFLTPPGRRFVDEIAKLTEEIS